MIRSVLAHALIIGMLSSAFLAAALAAGGGFAH
jgi:hypothetical protein